jgi:K+-sensing histidine kinase KdpD
MTPDQRDLMLQGIVYDTDRLNGVLRQLVDAARLTAGSLELFPERTDVGALVAQIAASFGRDPDHPPVEWVGGEVVAFVDPERLRMIVEGFIESLVWWTSEGPVRIHAEAADGRFVLSTERGAAQLDQGQADRLFLPREPGTGAGSKLGLFVADGVARAQGGRAYAKVDGTLRLVLEIPLADPPVD